MIRSELIELLRASASPNDTVGVEIEVLAVEPASGRPAPASRISRALARYSGDASFEAPGQIEVRTAPAGSVRELTPKIGAVIDEARTCLAGEDLRGLTLGFQPFADLGSIAHTSSPTALSAEEMTLSLAAAVHVSLSYRDELDAARKLLVAHEVAPCLVAIFGGSPLARGQVWGVSFRASVWASAFMEHRIPTALLDGQAGVFERYVDWVLSRPARTSVPRARDALRFPSAIVRLKEVIEIRCIDSVPPRAVVAAAAFVRGLLVDPRNLTELSARSRAPADRARAWAAAARSGLGDSSLALQAEDLIARAAAGLARLGDDPDALRWARDAVSARRNWGQRVAEIWGECGRSPRDFVRTISEEIDLLGITAS